ncbi:hypothetical protein [Thalassomonas actiniarum]|uniref:Uncharacterized protein n=1 Tax=Thalassomonas actiniarum TaxID=485447 RepID=A0AAE9YUD4_9GAMM|nr:hypothetical protein [Thalassomonas actiniarum]WDE00993.1 hypothetical protein SG35_010375 [Thalassomonas actiniarum]
MKSKHKYFNSLLLAASLSTAAVTSSVAATEVPLEEDGFEIVAYYGDKLEDRVVVVDVNNMTLKSANATYGTDPYPVDKAGDLDKVYAVTRGSNSMDVIDSQTFEQIGLVELPHYPRSAEAYNAHMRLQLVTGADKPMASLIDIDTDTVIASVGENIVYEANGDYGGSNATGHPFWFSKKRFALIDRPNRTIHVYKVRLKRNGEYKVTELSSIATPTAVHHLMQGERKRIFYALAEGSAQNNYAPLVIKYKMQKGVLTELAQTSLAQDSIEVMGSHHANMHPDGQHMYIGSTEGNLYVLDTETMTIVKTIEVGLGAGHTTFAPDRNLAIVTNHKDTFVSVIDTTTHSLIKNVTVSGAQKNGTILQSHTSLVSPDMNYFYAFATDNGIFFELDLNTLEVSRTLETGGTPLQGVFLCDGQSCSGM